MSAHRRDEDISEIKTYFNTVIDWEACLSMCLVAVKIQSS